MRLLSGLRAQPVHWCAVQVTMIRRAGPRAARRVQLTLLALVASALVLGGWRDIAPEPYPSEYAPAGIFNGVAPTGPVCSEPGS